MGFESEELERAALLELHEAATPKLASDLGLSVTTVGSAVVSVAAALPPSAIVINRAIGAGLAGAETQETVGRMVEAYREAGVARYFIHRHPEARPAEMVNWMQANGLGKARG